MARAQTAAPAIIGVLSRRYGCRAQPIDGLGRQYERRRQLVQGGAPGRILDSRE
jgi:hypothetical protein